MHFKHGCPALATQHWLPIIGHPALATQHWPLSTGRSALAALHRQPSMLLKTVGL